MKKLLSILMTALLVLALAVPALAEEACISSLCLWLSTVLICTGLFQELWKA